MKPIVILTTFIAFSLVGSLRAGELNELINHYAALAKTQDALFDGFDVGRGKSLYITKSLDKGWGKGCQVDLLNRKGSERPANPEKGRENPGVKPSRAGAMGKWGTRSASAPRKACVNFKKESPETTWSKRRSRSTGAS